MTNNVVNVQFINVSFVHSLPKIVHIFLPKLVNIQNAFVIGCCRDLNSLQIWHLRCSAAPQPCLLCVTKEISVLA